MPAPMMNSRTNGRRSNRCNWRGYVTRSVTWQPAAPHPGKPPFGIARDPLQRRGKAVDEAPDVQAKADGSSISGGGDA